MIETTDKPETSKSALRFRLIFLIGGAVLAVLGALALIAGDGRTGLLLIAAGGVAWLFAKRRSRRADA